MIAIDTSAIVAIGLREDGWEDCFSILRRERDLVMSAVTLAEIMVVAARRGVSGQMRAYMTTLAVKIVPVTDATAHRVAEIYDRWGKGLHPATLNICDCFSYDTARQYDCPLLYVGNDFARTDIPSALA